MIKFKYLIKLLMDIKNIKKFSFCNREIDNIIDDRVKEYILEDLNSKKIFISNYAKLYKM